MVKKKPNKVVAKTKKSPTSRPLVWFLSISLVITTAFILLRLYFPPQPTDIFFVSEPQLTYGETAVTGVLSRSGEAFILDIGNNNLVELDMVGLDQYLGQTITAYGMLSRDVYLNNVMQVNEIRLAGL